MDNRKVYIVNQSLHDYSPAQKFGELIYLTSGRWKRLKVNEMFRVMYEKLRHSKPNDYLLLSGLANLQCIAVGIMVALHGKVNLLLVHERENKIFYVEKNLNFTEVINETAQIINDERRKKNLE